jgi:hypothetical protein
VTKLRTTALLLTFALLTLSTMAVAQAPGDDPTDATKPLYKTIAALDAALFDAYNHCELDKMGALVADDLEFYHDQTGLSRGRQSLLDAVKTNICGKVRRDLVAGSLEVYPLKNYGAVEIGVHRFHNPNIAGDVGGEAKFVQLWQETANGWKLTRVISFNHYSLPIPPANAAEKPAAK